MHHLKNYISLTVYCSVHTHTHTNTHNWDRMSYRHHTTYTQQTCTLLLAIPRASHLIEGNCQRFTTLSISSTKRNHQAWRQEIRISSAQQQHIPPHLPPNLDSPPPPSKPTQLFRRARRDARYSNGTLARDQRASYLLLSASPQVAVLERSGEKGHLCYRCCSFLPVWSLPLFQTPPVHLFFFLYFFVVVMGWGEGSLLVF